MHGAAHASHRAPPRPAVDVGAGAHGAAPSAAANHAGASGTTGVVNGVAHAAGGVPANNWLAATFSGVSAGPCAHAGSPSDNDLTPRLDAPDAGQDLGGSSGFSGLPVNAVQEDAAAGLEELSDLDNDEHMDVLSVLRDGAPRFDDNDNDADLVVSADVQVGVSGGAGGLSGGVSVCVSLGVSLGVSPVAALPPPSHSPPSFLDS